MTTEMRHTGVDVVGDMAWGTHFCVFYDTKADLLDTLVSYCRAGLESGEFCLWVVAPPLTEDDARQALKRAVPGFDQYLSDRSIEIVAAREWYLHDGKFDLKRVVDGWNEKLAHASARGYAGVRVTGDTAWLGKNDWKDFCEYEESLNDSIANQRLAVLCTYPIVACGAAEILDVVRTHQFAITKRRGDWEVIETAGHKQAKSEIKRLNEDLERRVVERTGQLTAANRQLMEEALERQRAEEALRRSEAYLDDLAARLIHAQEEERSRIGRELHDHISQTLGVATIKIDQLRAHEGIGPDIGRALDELRQETSALTDDVHRLSHRLHSSTLDYLGLVPALQKLVSEFSERHGISITFTHASLPAPLPSEVALCLFRVTEEGLTNIAKHSKAPSANVQVSGAPDGIHLKVEDAGSGFDMTAPASRAGLGFVSMQERLRALHGTIRVDSAPSRGTRIDAWVPQTILTSAPNVSASIGDRWSEERISRPRNGMDSRRPASP